MFLYRCHLTSQPIKNFGLNAIDNLKRCQGDCRNGGCADGLICFKREANEEVPGCIGEQEVALEGHGYCVREEVSGSNAWTSIMRANGI